MVGGSKGLDYHLAEGLAIDHAFGCLIDVDKRPLAVDDWPAPGPDEHVGEQFELSSRAHVCAKHRDVSHEERRQRSRRIEARCTTCQNDSPAALD
jgi:hypothetical protein